MYANQLSSHASLLLSASPTIVTSPLQNNSNPQTPPQPATIALIRRQPSTPLLSANNVDNDSHSNTDSPTNSSLPDGYINFKKPQNEIFKKLDGKIQKIVAAHSNLNKLYALNDFSGSTGPRRPFELPAQLPPPPPWIPKVAADYVGQWASDPLNALSASPEILDCKLEDSRPGPSIIQSGARTKLSKPCSLDPSPSKSPNPTIDSAITKLHQRRQQQLQQQPMQTNRSQLQQPRSASQLRHSVTQISGTAGPSTSLAPISKPTATITPAQFTLLTQQIRETLEKRRPSNNNGDKSLSEEDRKEFKAHLIAILKDEIASVAKSANLSSNLAKNVAKPKTIDQKSLLMKTNPQTLFNTIRRETSLLLGKREHINKSISSPLNDQNSHNSQSYSEQVNSRSSPTKIPSTIMIIVPPTECHPLTKVPERIVRGDSGCEDEPDAKCNVSLTHPNLGINLSYQVIKNKIKSFQETNKIYLGISNRTNFINTPMNFKKKKGTQKSLDKIVDRLQAKCTPSPTEPDLKISCDQKAPYIHQQASPSANLLRTSRVPSTISAPTPIPVFRTAFVEATKGNVYCSNSSGVTKVINSKMKKSKRIHHFGLKLGNYLEKECPQQSTEGLTIEQFARCLNLVRSNDISLQRHQEQLLHAEAKWRMPISNRPLRLRRIRGERIHMPASASYRATRKVGLQ